MNIMTLDFASLCAEEKRDLIYTLDQALDESTAEFSFQQKILAQTLFVARSYHFYEQVFGKLSLTIPALYQDTMEMVWLYLSGEISESELEEFYQSAESVFTCLMTGDEEFLDEAAWEKYAGDWDFVCCGICLADAVAPYCILEQIASGVITWYELPDNQLMDSIGTYISDCSLEPVFKNESCGYTYDELQRHNAEVYGSSTFTGIFRLFLEDFCLVKDLGQPTKDDIFRLREQYRNKELFGSEQVTKIAEWLQGLYQ